ncbi:hypothetical protein ACJ72_05055 [Emergomyces africanus]|uniref:Uncharacterized protein n=1 Tax=Emergomyces africanus TaxID=1955775 RepID=A0A1B7NVD0_9EURO|nr:hypothetical protein ACJ72_05055 [Emergomyces africanus]
MSSSTTRLKFLKSSAHYLAAQSPSTSSHLLAVHNQLLRDESKLLSVAQHRDLCGACGAIRTSSSSKIVIPTKHGRGAERRNRGRVASKEETPSSEAPPLVVYRCLRCHRQKFLTSQSLIKPAKSRKTHPVAAAIPSAAQIFSDTQMQGTESTSTVLRKSTENLSSKKRAKARKQQGLMAALAAGKQRMQPQTSTSPSLDLLDFLKP